MHETATQSDPHPNQKRRLDSPSLSPKSTKIPKSEDGGMSSAPGNVQRYLVAVEYVGTRFFGSQKQPNVRTVVGVLDEAFEKFVGKPVSIHCSSRTDAGVHALSNVCHVDVERISKRKPGEILPAHEPSVVRRAVNHFLKNDDDIMIIDVQCIPMDFHARFKAQERIYFYRILSGPEALSVFEKNHAWHVQEDLNIHAMQDACNTLIGCHDFSSFRASGCQAKSPIKTLDELRVSEVIPSPYFPSTGDSGIQESSTKSLSCDIRETRVTLKGSVDSQAYIRNGSDRNVRFGQKRGHRCFIITARAQSFLYHQVRLLVGVLKSVGTGELAASDVKAILDAKTVTAAKPMAPACGLYLGNVKYDLPS